MGKVKTPEPKPGAACPVCGKPVSGEEPWDYVKSKRLMLWVHQACAKGGRKK